jgi:hypothetical protein
MRVRRAGPKNRLFEGYSPEIAQVLAAKTLTLDGSRLGCPANAGLMAGFPIPDI